MDSANENGVRLCLQCIHHPGARMLVGAPCRLLMQALAQARRNCNGVLWEEGHETRMARRWLRSRS